MHDVNKVVSLFSPDVEYWETPFMRLASFESLASEWDAIRDQSDIQIDTKLFLSHQNSHCITWDLSYKDKSGKWQQWAGTYLIVLNDTGACTYFCQTGEPKK